MKKLSTELTKSFRILILLFTLSFVGIMVFFGSYIKNVSHEGIVTTNGFINYETSEFEEKLKGGRSLDSLFLGALDECPKIPGVSVAFIYQDKIYPENYPQKLLNISLEKEFSEDIQSEGFYRYELLKREIDIKGLKPIGLLIIKDMEEDREIILGIIKVSVVIILVTLFLSFYVSRKFYNRLIPALKNLQDITNKISLDNMEHKVKPKSSFVEFDKVISSYEDMLKRVKRQADAQVDFVNSASHELKTPLFIISGYVGLVKRWGLDNKEILKEALDSIEEESKDMSALVSKLLFLAKDNKTEIEYSSFDLGELIENILNNFKIIYPHQKFNFISKEVDILSDYDLIKQLLVNLIENAIKYGSQNEIDIDVIQNQNLSVVIKDRGEGISRENLNSIYDRFFRVDKARSRDMRSHGLGLSIVKKICETLNIDMDIESEVGVGTQVTITLPFTKK